MLGNIPGETSCLAEREEQLEAVTDTEVLEVLQRDNVFVSEVVHHLYLPFQCLSPAVVFGGGCDLFHGPHVAVRQLNGLVYDAKAARPLDLVSIFPSTTKSSAIYVHWVCTRLSFRWGRLSSSDYEIRTNFFLGVFWLKRWSI